MSIAGGEWETGPGWECFFTLVRLPLPSYTGEPFPLLRDWMIEGHTYGVRMLPGEDEEWWEKINGKWMRV